MTSNSNALKEYKNLKNDIISYSESILNLLISNEKEALEVAKKPETIKTINSQIAKYNSILKSEESKIKFIEDYLEEEFEFIKISRGITILGHTYFFKENPLECWDFVKNEIKNGVANNKIETFIRGMTINNLKNQSANLYPTDNERRIILAITTLKKYKNLKLFLNELAMKPIKVYSDLCKQIDILNKIKITKLSKITSLEDKEKPQDYQSVDYSIEIKSHKVRGEWLGTFLDIVELSGEIENIDYLISKYKKLKKEIDDYINSLNGIEYRVARLWIIENMKISQIAFELKFSEDYIKKKTSQMKEFF